MCVRVFCGGGAIRPYHNTVPWLKAAAELDLTTNQACRQRLVLDKQTMSSSVG